MQSHKKTNQQGGKMNQSSREQNATTQANPPPSGEKLGKELTDNAPANEAVDEPGIIAKPWEDRPFSTGRKIENHLPDDDQVTEQMVQEGADDAEEDDVITAKKTGSESEG
jgi:hypothetical protein